MEIGEAVDRPRVRHGQFGKFEQVWTAVAATEDGKAIPVKCADREELHLLQVAANTLRSLRLSTKRNGLTLYIWKREGKNHSGQLAVEG